MSMQYRAVIAGLAHVHINDVAAHFAAHPRVDLRACADLPPLVPELKAGPYTREWNKAFCARSFNLKPYDSWLEMLEAEEPDLCVVNSENAYHVMITEECARRGIDVCIEKPMAASLSDGLRMHRAALAGGIALMVNWPMTWNAGMQTIRAMIEEGAVGDVIQIKTRMGHTGPLGPGAKHRGVTETAGPMTDVEKARTWWHQHACGGGAMADYCCYGGMLSYWFAGEEAQAVTGMRLNSATPMGDAEDNAAMIVRFPHRYAVIEGTWTTYDHTFQSPIVYGTKGAIVGDYKTGAVALYPAGWSAREVKNRELPKPLTNVAHAYACHKDTGVPPHITLQPGFNLNALAILDAGIRSADSGKVELVDNLHWRIG